MASISNRITAPNPADEIGVLWCDKCQTLMAVTKELYEVPLKKKPIHKSMAIIHQCPICKMKIGKVVVKSDYPWNSSIYYNKIN